MQAEMNGRYWIRSNSEEDTAKFAAQMADSAFAGMVIGLDGDLGAGKTRFSQAFAKAIGVIETVNSPTFTLIKEYNGFTFPLYHMDVYRLCLEEAEELGLDEYFYGEGICIIEWAARIHEILPEERLHIHMKYISDHEREVVVTPNGLVYDEYCQNLQKSGVFE